MGSGVSLKRNGVTLCQMILLPIQEEEEEEEEEEEKYLYFKVGEVWAFHSYT